jgi:3,2-trans-enoyl-CoA isomerase
MLINHIQHGEVLELNMQRPPVNALNPELVGEISQAIINAPQNSKALVISGKDGLFSAGLDVLELMQLERQDMTVFWKAFFGLLEAIAAGVSLFCDYRIMSQGNFKIGLNETRVGLMVPEVIRRALIRLTGQHKAERLIVEGALIQPEEALNCGMIDALSQSPQSAIGDAVSWCRQLLELPSHAMLGNRALLRSELCRDFDLLGEADIANFVNEWFGDETQSVLQQVVYQLKNKT